MIKRLLIISILTFFTFHIAKAIDESNPYKLTNEVLKNTFNRLKSEKLKIRNNPEYLLDIVEQELLPYIQTQYVAALVLGRHYRENITSSQFSAYFSVFREYLKRLYAQILTMYHGQEYKIISTKQLDNASIIPVRVAVFSSNNRPPVQIDFQWRKNSQNNSWRLYDIIIEGVSIIDSKRNEWSSLLRTEGIEGLTRKLQSIIVQKHSKN